MMSTISVAIYLLLQNDPRIRPSFNVKNLACGKGYSYAQAVSSSFEWLGQAQISTKENNSLRMLLALSFFLSSLHHLACSDNIFTAHIYIWHSSAG